MVTTVTPRIAYQAPGGDRDVVAHDDRRDVTRPHTDTRPDPSLIDRERARCRAQSPSTDAGGYAAPAALSVARTRAGVIGASRMRSPVASKNALAMAAPVGTSVGSPEPPGCRSVRCTVTTCVRGASLKRIVG